MDGETQFLEAANPRQESPEEAFLNVSSEHEPTRTFATARHAPSSTEDFGPLESVPFLRTALHVERDVRYGRARRRLEAGQPEEGDLQRVADYEAQQQRASEAPFEQRALHALRSVPAIAGEFQMGGALVPGALSEAAPLISRAAFASRGAFGRAVGQTAAYSLAVPSMVLDPLIHGNLEQGRDPLDPRGLPAAAGIGMANTAVLGSLSRQFPNLGRLTGAVPRAFAGVLESEVANYALGMTGLQTSRGTIGDWLDGKNGRPLQDLAITGLTFGAFSLMHGRPRQEAEQVMRTIAEEGPRAQERLQIGLDRLRQSPQVTGEQLKSIIDSVVNQPKAELPEPPQWPSSEGWKFNEQGPHDMAPQPHPYDPLRALGYTDEQISNMSPWDRTHLVRKGIRAQPHEGPAFHITDYKQPERSAKTALDILARKGTPPRPLEVWSGEGVRDRFEGQMISQGHTAFEFDRGSFTGEQTHAPNQGRMTSTDPLRYNPGLKRVIYKGKGNDAVYQRLKEMVAEVNKERDDAGLMREHGHSGALDPVELALHRPVRERSQTEPQTVAKPWEADTEAALRSLGHPAKEAKQLVKDARESGKEFGSPQEALAAINRAIARKKQGLDPWAPEAKPSLAERMKQKGREAQMKPVEGEVKEPKPAHDFTKEEVGRADSKADWMADAGMTAHEALVYQKKRENPEIGWRKLTKDPDIIAAMGEVSHEHLRGLGKEANRKAGALGSLDASLRAKALEQLIQQGHGGEEVVAELRDAYNEMAKKLDRLFEKGKIDEQEYERRNARLEKQAENADRKLRRRNQASLRRKAGEALLGGGPRSEAAPPEAPRGGQVRPEPAAAQGGEAAGNQLMVAPSQGGKLRSTTVDPEIQAAYERVSAFFKEQKEQTDPILLLGATAAEYAKSYPSDTIIYPHANGEWSAVGQRPHPTLEEAIFYAKKGQLGDDPTTNNIRIVHQDGSTEIIPPPPEQRRFWGASGQILEPFEGMAQFGERNPVPDRTLDFVADVLSSKNKYMRDMLKDILEEAFPHEGHVKDILEEAQKRVAEGRGQQYADPKGPWGQEPLTKKSYAAQERVRYQRDMIRGEIESHLKEMMDNELQRANPEAPRSQVDAEGQEAIGRDPQLEARAQEGAEQRTEEQGELGGADLPAGSDVGDFLPGGMGAAGGPSGAGAAPLGGTPGAGIAPSAPAPTPTAASWFRRALDGLKSFANQAFPALTRLSQRSGEKLAEAANAKAASKSTWDYISRVVKAGNVSVRDMSVPEQELIGAVVMERRSRLLREAKQKAGESAADVVTFIGPDSPLKTEADYQHAWENLWSFFESAKQEWTPEVDRNYRGILGLDPEDEINSRSQIPQLPFNAIPLQAEDIGKPGVVGTGLRGMGGVRISKPSFTRKAELNAPAYDINIAHMMEQTLDKGIQAARRAEFVRQALKDGVIEAVGGKRQEQFLDQFGPEAPRKDKPTEGWAYLALDPAKGMAGLDPNARYYAHPEAYRDIVQGLGIGERPGQSLGEGMKPFVDKLYSVSLMAPVELLTHIGNHLTSLFRSGMGFPLTALKNSVMNAFKLWRGDPETYRKVMDLAKIGASFGHEARSGVLGAKADTFLKKYTLGIGDPTARINEFTSKFIDTMQKAFRVQLGDAYDRMVQSGHFPESQTGKRDFINQALGNYNSKSNNRITQFLKDTGIQSFATAAHTFTVQGIKSLWGGAINAKAETYGKALELRAIALMKYMPILALGPVVNSLMWGQAFPANVPAFAIKTREDQDRVGNWDPLSFTGLRRGARATGVNALVEGMLVEPNRYQRNQVMLDRAIGDGWLSLAHLFEGPPMQFLHTAQTGENVFGRHIAPRARQGQSQRLMNIGTAFQNVNPLIGTFTGGDKPRMPRTFLENVFQSLGPFGERTRRR